MPDPRRLTARERALRTVSETEFQRDVLQCATMLGWRHYHTYDSRKSNGGFPDLVLVRERVVYAELKRRGPRGVVSADQLVWHEALRVAGAELYVWRPGDLEDVARILRRPVRATVTGNHPRGGGHMPEGELKTAVLPPDDVRGGAVETKDLRPSSTPKPGPAADETAESNAGAPEQ